MSTVFLSTTVGVIQTFSNIDLFEETIKNKLNNNYLLSEDNIKKLDVISALLLLGMWFASLKEIIESFVVQCCLI